jgi:hypothetical protein
MPLKAASIGFQGNDRAISAFGGQVQKSGAFRRRFRLLTNPVDFRRGFFVM